MASPKGLTESRFFGAKPSVGTPNHEEDLWHPLLAPLESATFWVMIKRTYQCPTRTSISSWTFRKVQSCRKMVTSLTHHRSLAWTPQSCCHLRREINVTPTGRHTAVRQNLNAAPQKMESKPHQFNAQSKTRKSLMFFHEVKNSSKVDIPRGDVITRPLFHESSGSDLSDEVNSNAQLRI